MKNWFSLHVTIVIFVIVFFVVCLTNGTIFLREQRSERWDINNPANETPQDLETKLSLPSLPSLTGHVEK